MSTQPDPVPAPPCKATPEGSRQTTILSLLSRVPKNSRCCNNSVRFWAENWPLGAPDEWIEEHAKAINQALAEISFEASLTKSNPKAWKETCAAIELVVHLVAGLTDPTLEQPRLDTHWTIQNRLGHHLAGLCKGQRIIHLGEGTLSLIKHHRSLSHAIAYSMGHRIGTTSDPYFRQHTDWSELLHPQGACDGLAKSEPKWEAKPEAPKLRRLLIDLAKQVVQEALERQRQLRQARSN